MVRTESLSSQSCVNGPRRFLQRRGGSSRMGVAKQGGTRGSHSDEITQPARLQLIAANGAARLPRC